MKARRLVYFCLGVAGGLLAGAGAVLEWQAVNYGGVRKIFGIDTLFGLAALIVSVVVIVVTLVTRKGSTEEPRTWGAPVVLALGAVITAIGALAASGASFVYDPSRNSEAERLAKAGGTTPAEIMKVWDEGTQITMGPGPWLVLAGGLLSIGAALAGFAWRRTWRASSEATAGEAAAGGGSPDYASESAADMGAPEPD